MSSAFLLSNNNHLIMKLSKVQRVLDLYQVKNMDEYRILQYNPDLVPDTFFHNGADKRHCQVSLLYCDGSIETLAVGEKTREKADHEDVIAVFTEYHHMNRDATETYKYEKTILVK